MLSGDRMDVEASNLKKKLNGIGSLQKSANEGQENAPERTTLTVEVSLA